MYKYITDGGNWSFRHSQLIQISCTLFSINYIVFGFPQIVISPQARPGRVKLGFRIVRDCSYKQHERSDLPRKSILV